MVKNAKYFVAAFLLVFFLVGSQARAINPVITQPTDFWFEYAEPTQFIAQTYMTEGINSDPQLWLYTEDNQLITSNDDYYGLQSYISIELQPGRYRLRAAVCCGNPDGWYSGNGWNTSYELAFNGEPASTTTTTAPTTTTTTLLPSTTTTSTTTSTTTTEPPTTTSSTYPTTTSTSTTTTLEPTTTTSTTTTTTSEAPATTTTTEAPAPSTTVPQDTSTTSSSTSSTIPVQVTTTTLAVVPDTTVPPQPSAIAVAINPEALASIDKEEAAEVFKALDIDELTDTQVEELVAAVQDAPVSVREAFEEEINIFGGGGLDDYVPVGSNIPVGERRVLIAIGAVTSVAPTVRRRK